jgi:DNA polymerase IV
LPSPVDTAAAILAAADPLLANVDPTPGVRLLGVHASNFGPPMEQMRLDDAVPADWSGASGAIDAIRERFGAAAIGPASTVSKQGLRLVRRGAQQWGPDHEGESSGAS